MDAVVDNLAREKRRRLDSHNNRSPPTGTKRLSPSPPAERRCPLLCRLSDRCVHPVDNLLLPNEGDPMGSSVMNAVIVLRQASCPAPATHGDEEAGTHVGRGALRRDTCWAADFGTLQSGHTPSGSNVLPKLDNHLRLAGRPCCGDEDTGTMAPVHPARNRSGGTSLPSVRLRLRTRRRPNPTDEVHPPRFWYRGTALRQ